MSTLTNFLAKVPLASSALNVALDNLSMHQLVKVPIHRRCHTLDWLITNRVTDVLDLTVVDMMLSDQFVISFNLLLRNLAPMSISGCDIPFSQFVRNLGVYLDETLSGTVCHHIFLTFFVHTTPLGRCALLTPHC